MKKFYEVKESAEEIRIRASDYFSKKKWDQAIKLYQRVLQIVSLTLTSDQKEETDKNDFLFRINMNLAICFNKKEDWTQTMTHISYLEKISNIEDQPKILFAKGKALMMLGENNKASESLKKALKLRPLDTQISQTLDELKKRITSYEDFQKNFSKNLKLQ